MTQVTILVLVPQAQVPTCSSSVSSGVIFSGTLGGSVCAIGLLDGSPCLTSQLRNNRRFPVVVGAIGRQGGGDQSAMNSSTWYARTSAGSMS